MWVPPPLLQRLAAGPAVLALELLLLVLSPLLAVLAALAGPLAGGRRPLRVLAIVLVYVARHLAACAACAALWVAARGGRDLGSERMQRAHYAVLAWFVSGLCRTGLRAARANVRVLDSDDAAAVLHARRRPVLVLSRHAGEGDSLLVLYELLCRYERRPRVVMHELLRLDPLIGSLGARLPNRFVDPRGGDTEREIASMATGLPAGAAVLIFPEGANFTPERRRRGIARLLERGHRGQARKAEAMSHVSAPRPGGALAALEAAPDADVVFLGHSGFPTGAAELWRLLAEPQTIDLRLWVVPAEDVPADRAARIDWLFEHWGVLDAWVAAQPATRPGPGRHRV